MDEPRQADGRFAPGKRKPRGKAFQRGRAKTGGRAPGTPNRAPRAIKEWLASLVDDPDVQDGVKEKIMRGDSVAFFRAIDHVLGKPKETLDANVNLVGLEERLKAARKRWPNGDS